jgi:ribonuclease R
MSNDLESRIMKLLTGRGPASVKPNELARRLSLTKKDTSQLRRAIRNLIKDGRVEYGKNHALRPTNTHGSVTGTFRRLASGDGVVRPHAVDGAIGTEIFIYSENTLDAANGDDVLVKVLRKPSTRGNPTGQILSIVERATNAFVGTYFERDGNGYVRVDGTVFSHSIDVGDPGAKGAKPDDKVVFEMVRFPASDDRGEGVITEILGPRGKPGVDTLSIIRAFGIPDEFPPDVLREARDVAAAFDENDLSGREDFTGDTVITIDPVDARDFDDAIALTRDERTGRWTLYVHIADVSHFAAPGGSLDGEARKRGTSVYLPQRVIPMFPEVISNSLASLQQDRVRYVKTAIIEFDAKGQRTNASFANGAIRHKRRFNYGEVSKFLATFPPGEVPDEPKLGGVSSDVLALLLRMRELAMMLRARRRKRGALELVMPEVELEYDENGRISGAHFAENDVSHQIIEEFMLAANEAVAEHLASLDAGFLRRVHPAPEPEKLQAFAEFARILGYKVELHRDRFALQKVLEQSTGKPEQHAVHFALLRSLKQAVYSPAAEGHYALASDEYCHFTSPIRRYPDLTVHRLLGRWLKNGKVGSNNPELVALGDHCSRTERRAETAERELIKVKLLTYMEMRIGEKMPAVITGVADYGFYAQAEQFPAEGLVHISSLTDDYYAFDADSHTLEGRRTRRRYRLGDRVKVEVARVDVGKRQMDFRIAQDRSPQRKQATP